MPLKITTQFGPTPGGPFFSLSNWSETYWSDSNLDVDTFATLLVNGLGQANFVQCRKAIMTPGWSIIGIKVSDAVIQRDVSERTLAMPGTFSGLLENTDEQPYDRLLYNMQSASRKRSARVGAIPTSVVDPGGNYKGFPPGATGKPQAWHSLFVGKFGPSLNANNLGIRFIDSKTPFAITAVLLTEAAPFSASGAQPILKIDGNAMASFPLPSTVTITRIRGMSGLIGQWTVFGTVLYQGNTYLYLRAKRGNTVTGVYEPGGFVIKLTFAYALATGVGPKRGVSRKPGRPFNLPRGRSSNRRR